MSISQGRFGFHPCDYQTFIKLKLINKIYHQALRQFSAWNRWNRKAPHNRKTTEPTINTLFIEKIKKKVYSKNGVWIKEGYLIDCITFNEQATLIDDFYNAKYPKESQEKVFPLRNSLEEIDLIFNQLI
jgi:hypothetical protein